jgi:hypothetical protein
VSKPAFHAQAAPRRQHLHGYPGSFALRSRPDIPDSKVSSMCPLPLARPINQACTCRLHVRSPADVREYGGAGRSGCRAVCLSFSSGCRHCRPHRPPVSLTIGDLLGLRVPPACYAAPPVYPDSAALGDADVGGDCNCPHQPQPFSPRPARLWHRTPRPYVIRLVRRRSADTRPRCRTRCSHAHDLHEQCRGHGRHRAPGHAIGVRRGSHAWPASTTGWGTRALIGDLHAWRTRTTARRLRDARAPRRA